MQKILVFGKNGQVGSNLLVILKNAGIGLDRQDVDLSNLFGLENYLNNLNFAPDAIIDAGAYTAVDKAEVEGKELNYLVNQEAPKVIAKYCKDKNIPFVYYTSDYVFDGKGEEPFREDNKDNLKPLNEYGKSKLQAEREIQKIGGKYLIFRTSWLYNQTGRNFVLTMIKLAKDRGELSIINDQIGSPTYAFDCAKYTLEVLKKAMQMNEFPSGIYHLVNNGYTSWYGFAMKIFELVRQKGAELKLEKVNAIPTSQYPTPAKRPHNSRLNIDKIKKMFNLEIRNWEEALKDCIGKINFNN